MDIKLSVIIPLYINENEDLTERIGFPVQYTDKLIEYIYVVASDDRVPEKLSKLADDTEMNVRVIKLPLNNGLFSLARARNTGVANAQGEMVLFSDIDLFPHALFYSNVLDFIEKRGLINSSNLFYPIPVIYLRPLSAKKATTELSSIVHHDDLLFGVQSKDIENIHRISSSILMSKSFYQIMGGQYEGFEGWGFEDWHFLWKLMKLPQPVPQPREFDQFAGSSPALDGDYRSWRGAAEMLGEEALRANLYLFHAHHPQRMVRWKTRKDDNQRLFNRLISAKKLAIDCGSGCALTRGGGALEIFSSCPSVANRLFYGPGVTLKLRAVDDIASAYAVSPENQKERVSVLGGLKLRLTDLHGASYLIRKRLPFKLAYPTSLSSRNMMLDFDGENFSPHLAESIEGEVEQMEHALVMECGGLEYYAAADSFRHERGLLGKKLVLVHFSEQTIDENVNGLFGLNDVDLRGLLFGIAPLFDEDTVFIVHDTGIRSTPNSPFKNLIFASDRDLEMLYAAADKVITQAPSDVWQAIIRKKPVTTTGGLLSGLIGDLPVLTNLVQLYEWISEDEYSISTGMHDTYLERLVASTSRFILTRNSQEAPERITGSEHHFRVLYEKVNHSLYRANYKFAWDSWDRRHYNVVNPLISRDRSMKFHREVAHDYRALARRPNAKLHPNKARVVTQRPAPNLTRGTGTSIESETRASRYKASNPERMGLIAGGPGTFGRKLNKLKKDPYRYFADAKNPLIRNLKYVFAN